jgi:chlorobactene glucosyltransferase
MTPLILLAGSSVLFMAALAILIWLHTQAYLAIKTPAVRAPQAGPRVSVLVPARNEAHNIRHCAQALLAQDYPNYEVLVLEDRSTDATPAILAELSVHDPRLGVLHGAELPPGWAGKPHALHQAASAASGEWLLFVDADTFLAPNAVSAALAAAEAAGADLFTVMTEQVTGSFWERVVMPLVMTALSVGFSPRRVNDASKRDAVANGQFILIRRAVYDALGGHLRLKHHIVEDKALAELVKWSGYRLVVADGRGVAQTRMYTSLAQMWEGWTKNIYLGLSDHPAMLLLGAFGAFLALVAALFLPAWPLLGGYWILQGGGWPALVVLAQALLVWAALLGMRMSVNAQMKIPRAYALTTPLGAGIFAAMMLTSAFRVLSGRGVTWKGRRYDPRGGELKEVLN